MIKIVVMLAAVLLQLQQPTLVITTEFNQYGEYGFYIIRAEDKERATFRITIEGDVTVVGAVGVCITQNKTHVMCHINPDYQSAGLIIKSNTKEAVDVKFVVLATSADDTAGLVSETFKLTKIYNVFLPIMSGT